ncbi:2-octaprenyl-6-methoxyphenyl hydroxylase [Pseudolabrys sp. Root1462]|uniref:UbiH/UbiF family hydroxylase n=1 Tax=Pseudolabrys sp. Root1462 TaxID=1736466 RepID=UPI000702A179|nr:UbiH/UbiF family hydroxylase [Pseudolabrys sp. Root1462]KQZ01083.1 2-octaprenyl-6-methoxyphenyl hydroxylase [Pseudolabrys sp. Root1462]
MSDKTKTSGALVVGGGPAALTAAIALAQAGMATVLAGKRPPRADNRTTALLAGSIAALEKLGVWELCVGKAAPLVTMRLVDDTGRLLRAPEVKFEAHEIDLDAFGYNIENPVLIDALEERARALPNLRMIDDVVIAAEPGVDDVTITLKSGARFAAPLTIGADGRNSMCRAAAEIESSEHRYHQVALTVCLKHTRPHHDTSTEFHTTTGPFTLVPLPGNRSSLVWVLRPHEADELAALDDDDLALEIERAAHSILGKMTLEPGRALFPLSTRTAARFGAHRIALVGEAAHVIPPIGAQGLNLGLRDAVTIAELAGRAHDEGRDIGGDDVLIGYDRARRGDVASRGLVIDIANRTLLSDFLPLQGLRGLGLYALDRIGPLRRAVMREGVAPRAKPELRRGRA